MKLYLYNVEGSFEAKFYDPDTQSVFLELADGNLLRIGVGYVAANPKKFYKDGVSKQSLHQKLIELPEPSDLEMLVEMPSASQREKLLKDMVIEISYNNKSITAPISMLPQIEALILSVCSKTNVNYSEVSWRLNAKD